MTEEEKVFAELKRLQDTLAQTGRARVEAGTRRAALEAAALPAADEARIEAYASLARGQDDASKRVGAAEKEKARLLGELDRVRAEEEGAHRAHAKLEAEIDSLRERHFDVFARHAERFTQVALEAGRAAQTAYGTYWAAWREAHVVWGPLCRVARLSPPAVEPPGPPASTVFADVRSVLPRPAGVAFEDDEAA